MARGPTNGKHSLMWLSAGQMENIGRLLQERRAVISPISGTNCPTEITFYTDSHRSPLSGVFHYGRSLANHMILHHRPICSLVLNSRRGASLCKCAVGLLSIISLNVYATEVIHHHTVTFLLWSAGLLATPIVLIYPAKIAIDRLFSMSSAMGLGHRSMVLHNDWNQGRTLPAHKSGPLRTTSLCHQRFVNMVSVTTILLQRSLKMQKAFYRVGIPNMHGI